MFHSKCSYNNKKRKLVFDDNDEEDFKEQKQLNIITHGNNIYYYESIDKIPILELISQLKELESLLINLKYTYDVNPVIKLHIYSEGGDAFMGLSIYDFIKTLKIPVYTYIDGLIASAATFLFLAGKKRFMTKNSNILIHQISTGFWGKFEDLKDEYKNTTELMKIAKKIYTDNTSMSKKTIDDIIKRELYLTYQDALKYNIVN
jgi:ATP-dependent protease ClpP protease subunit